MRAEALTQALGGRWHGTYGTARCPAHDDSRPSLSLKDGEDGRLLCHCFSGCAFPEIMAALRDRGYCPQSGAGERPSRGDRTDRPIADLIGIIWSGTVPIEGTPGERYLRGRAIEGPLPASLRFHPRLRHPTGAYRPAIVGRVDHVRAGVVGLHRTYLEPSTARKTGLQPAKAMLGACKGGAVRLHHGRAGLAVAEGIETALSLAARLDASVAVWAALSTSGMAGLEVPERACFGGKLMIGADGDPAGRRAASDLADRASLIGWQVEIVAAPDGTDFNDLMSEARHG